MKYIAFALLVICLISYTNAAAAPAFTKTKEVNNSDELDWLIEGGKEDLYIVTFYMPGDNHEELKADLEEKIAGNSKYQDIATYVEVNAARTYQYKEVLQDVGIYEKPSSMYPYVLVIKKGEHGALLFTDDGIFSAPAWPLEEVFDPTGAGDTFAGGFVGYLARCGEVTPASLRSAVIYGSALASFCVEKFGLDRILDLTAAEIDERVAAFAALSAFETVHPLSKGVPDATA